MVWLERTLGSISLAPVRYRNILAKNSPIQKITTYELPDQSFESVADLSVAIRGSFQAGKIFQIYSNHDGCGSDRLALVSRYKAISEALERWAWRETKSKFQQYSGGLTSSGYACFPSWTSTQARARAFDEAVERILLGLFALRRLRSRELKLGPNLLSQMFGRLSFQQIRCWIVGENTFSQGLIVLQGIVNASSSHSCYGFASHADHGVALQQASVELYRNARVLERHQSEVAVSPQLCAERRLLYFSSAQGIKTFDDLILANVRQEKVLNPPCVDKIIEGPWSKWSHVHRVLFELPPEVLDDSRDDVFWF